MPPVVNQSARGPQLQQAACRAAAPAATAADQANPNRPEYRPRRCGGASAATIAPAIPAVTISPAVHTAIVDGQPEPWS